MVRAYAVIMIAYCLYMYSDISLQNMKNKSNYTCRFQEVPSSAAIDTLFFSLIKWLYTSTIWWHVQYMHYLFLSAIDIHK